MEHIISHLSRKEKAKVQKAEKNNEIDIEDENLSLDSARNSFSQDLKEGQDRRFGSGSLLKKPDRRRPASLDLNNDVVNTCHYSFPCFGVMKKNPITTSRVGIFPSPRTPNYRHSNVEIQKKWSSEHVQLHPTANRRQFNTTLLPYNNGRALPSKYEYAERRIFSPVSRDGSIRNSLQQQQ